jgi:hypothetical protein
MLLFRLSVASLMFSATDSGGSIAGAPTSTPPRNRSVIEAMPPRNGRVEVRGTPWSARQRRHDAALSGAIVVVRSDGLAGKAEEALP